MSWSAVLVLGVGTYLMRLVGIVLRDRLAMPQRVERYLDLGATALLVALVATATLTEGGGFAGWARPAGVLVGAVAAWRSCWWSCSPPRPRRACACSGSRERARIAHDRARPPAPLGPERPYTSPAVRSADSGSGRRSRPGSASPRWRCGCSRSGATRR